MRTASVHLRARAIWIGIKGGNSPAIHLAVPHLAAERRVPPAYRVALFAAFTAVIAGCGTKEPPPAVTVLAAASTVDAVTEAAEAFRDTARIEVRVSGGASNALARQIESGAPADLFLSASPEWAEAARNRAAETKPLLANRLVLVVPKDNPAKVKTPQDLLEGRVRHVALAGEEVPAGRYADAALHALGLHDRLVPKKIARGHDVRATLAFVERGEAEAGIVYATDAAASDKVETVSTFDATLHDPIVYPVILLKGGPAGENGRRFFDFLFSDEARKVFRRHGFLPADAERSP